MLANYHTHTARCFHATGRDREYVENAIKSGLKVLGFSDHCPWVFNDGYVSGTRMPAIYIDEYFMSLNALKYEYADDITIYIGFESEYFPEIIEEQDKLFSAYPLDYMILGQHYNEVENGHNYIGRLTRDESVLEKNIDMVIAGMETGRYKYVAHPDIVNFVGDDEFAEKQYIRLCEYLKSKDIPIEINMLGLAENRHYPSARFLSVAHEVGNKAIIGIDAHSPLTLLDDYDIKKCIRIAEKYSFELVDYLPGLEPKK